MTDFDQIEKYLLSQMSDAEHQAFETQIASDENLQTEVDNYRTLLLGIETKSLKDKLALISKEKQSIPPKKVRNLYTKPLAIAASILLLLSAGLFLIQSETASPTELYAQYYNPDPGLPTVMGIEDQVDFRMAMNDYKQQSYSEALESFDAISEQISNDTLQYYKAMCHLNLNELDAAAGILSGIKENSVFVERKEWYQLLIALKTNDANAAAQIANKINANSKHFYYEEARQILDQLH